MPDAGISQEEVARLSERLRSQPVARETWPDSGRCLPLRDLLAQVAPEHGEALERAAVLAETMLAVPIIAVAGLNDQGKSSLVASFLSPAGAARVLRGTRLNQATYRFTLWLPDLWRQDPVLLSAINKALAGLFGRAPWPLPDSAEALGLQNANAELDVPLLAWDKKLNELGIGLLDCPDIQKRPPGAAEDAADRRHEMLTRAARLCAVTLVVARHENITTTEFRRVEQALPANGRVWAFNQVRDLQPAQVLAEAREALALPPEALCYAAYDYDLRQYETRTPHWDPNLDDEVTARFPCFFRLVPDAAENTPGRIDESRSIHRLPRELDRAARMREFQRTVLHDFREKAEAGLHAAEHALAGQDERLQRACEHVWDACCGALKGRDGQRIVFSAEMAQSLAQSLINCAPWWIRTQLACKALVGKGVRATAEFAARLTPEAMTRFGGTLVFAAGKMAKSFRKPAAPPPPQAEEPVPELLTRLLLGSWRAAGHLIEENELRPAVDRIIERFNTHGLANLPDKRWDEIATKFWEDAPKGRAAIATAGSLLLGLGLVIWTALEPLSGSTLWAFSVGTHAVALTVTELFAAVGLSALVHTACAVGLQHSLEQQLGPRQRYRFFLFACDELGLPREGAPGTPDADASASPNPDGLALSRFGLRRMQLDQQAIAGLRHALSRL